MTLQLVKHRLPPLWDGQRVEWGPYEIAPAVQVCPPPKAERCACGSDASPSHARGLRQPLPGEMVDSTKAKLGRFGRWVHVPARVPAWPLADLTAIRCAGCGEVTVWDMRTDEWWTLGPEDFGPGGSTRPAEREWSGGLFDLLPASNDLGSTSGD